MWPKCKYVCLSVCVQVQDVRTVPTEQCSKDMVGDKLIPASPFSFSSQHTVSTNNLACATTCLLCLSPLFKKKKNPILFWLKTAHNKCFQSTVAVVLLHMDKETPRTLERNLCCRLECGREVGFWCFTVESKGGRRGQKRIGPTPRAVFTLSMKFLSWIFPVTFIDFASKAHGGCWESPGLTLWIYQQSVSFLSIIETSEKIFVRNELFSILKQMCCIGIL